MITVKDRNQVLNLNYMSIYILINQVDKTLYVDKLKNLIKSDKLTRGLFKFNIVEKKDNPYEKLPAELRANTIGYNIMVRLINGIHGIYVYGLDRIDLSLSKDEIFERINSFVNETCENDIENLDVIINRSTQTAIDAAAYYQKNNIAKEIFENALKGIKVSDKIQRENNQAKVQSVDKNTPDFKTSLGLVKSSFSPNKTTLEIDNLLRNKPTTSHKIAITLKNVPTGKQYKNGKAKLGLGFEIKCDDQVIPVYLGVTEQKFLYYAALKANIDHQMLTRRDFTENFSTKRHDWLRKLFLKMNSNKNFDDWFQKIIEGNAHRIDDAKSKINKALKTELEKYNCKEALYYCGLDNKDSKYQVRINLTETE